LIERQGKECQWVIDSAGIGDWHVGNRPDKRGLAILKRNGVSNSHRARQVCPEDFRKFDLILAFDESNVEDLGDFKPKDSTAKVELFGDYDPKGEKIIHDPYYGDEEGFEVMYEHCYRCCEEFLKKHK
jgi:low molecular weight phosphotyrosine protein phosphatase